MRLPTFKKIHPVFQPRPGTIRLSEVPGVSVDVDDEDGSITRLIRLMDGTRTIEQLCQDMNTDESAPITLDDIAEAVEELNRLGFVYDQAMVQQTSLTDHELERFKANLAFLSNYANLDHPPTELQERLCNKKITIIGSGGFGSSILVSLAGMGVKHVRLVDFDHVSLSNLNRQILFKESDIGRLKIDVAREFISNLYSDMTLETIEMEVGSTADVERAITGSDLVVLAADQPFYVLQRWVNTACVKLGIPFIGGGINLTEASFHTIVPGHTGCVDCLYLHRLKNNADYVEMLKDYMAAGFVPATATVAPILFMVTAIIASEVFKFAVGLHDELVSLGKVVGFNVITLEKRANEWERDVDQCPTCGGGTSDTELFRLFKQLEDRAGAVILKY